MSSQDLAKGRPERPLLRRAIGLRRLVGLRRATPVWLLVATMAMLVAGLWYGVIGGLTPVPSPLLLPWPLLAVLFFVAERFVVDLEVREQTHSFSLSEIALVLGLVFASPVDLLVGQAVGAGGALLLRPGQRPVKLAFNLANFALGTSAALVFYHLVLGGAEPLSPVGWLAAFAAGLACDLTTGGSVAAVIWLTQRERPRFESLFGFGTAYMLVAASLGLVAATVLWHAPAAVWLLVVLVAMAYVGIRIHGRELRRQQSVIRLHESTRRIQQSFSFDDVSRSLLETAREMFAGELAEMLMFPEQGDEARLLRLSDGHASEWTTQRLDPTEGVWARVSAEGRGLIIRPAGASALSGPLRRLQRFLPARGATPERVLAHFAARGVRGAMVAPLRVEEASVGTLLVGNRHGSVAVWSDDDLTLLETLANHASVALHNSRQADDLARQRDELERSATHDSLTGLPNRVLFQARVREALKRRRSRGVAVLVMDLDRFKEVNDTLGHHNGDKLLCDVAARLSAALEGSTVARLGGDEFSILLLDADVGTAVAAADSVLQALAEPFLVQGVTVPVEASIGICLGPAHGDDAETLLRRADVAMYRAKADHSRYAVYEAQRDPYSEARLGLLGELRRAIEERELTVAYQPQVNGAGQIEGFEALLRWHHPQRGDLPPDEFVALAEHSELIHSLTRFVLEEAITQCAAWRRAGHAVRVSVNLSARNLADVGLADDVRRLLEEAHLPPSALQLEITETAVDADPLRSEEMLERLHAIGVHIAIDDFGAGYSSFSYLARLPVDEIKIDRSFVIGVESDKRRLAIVRSTIQLGHNLGLRVVAEGVETEQMRKRLARMGCDLVQGYHIGRATSADLAGALLRRPAPADAPRTSGDGPRTRLRRAV